MRHKTRTYALWLLLMVGALQSGCYREDESECIDSLQIAFRFTKGGADLFEPEVKSVSLFVFDENDLFVGRWDEFNSAVLRDGYTMSIDLAAGVYNCVTWGGLHDDRYIITDRSTARNLELIEGQTTIDELMLHIDCEEKEYLSRASRVVDYRPACLFYGSKMDVDLVKGQPIKITIELDKLSTQIRLIMSGLPMPARSHPYTWMRFHMDAANGQYDFRSRLEETPDPYTYIAQFVDADANNRLTMDIHTLRLKFGSGHRYTIYDTGISKPYFTADLLEDFIRPDSRYDTQEKVDAEDYFEIEMKMDAHLGWKCG